MTALLYADSSALVRAYLDDEREHGPLRRLLLETEDTVVTSELSSVELFSAFAAAQRAGRLSDLAGLLAKVDDTFSGSPIMPIRLDPRRVVPLSRHLVLDHRLRALDAIHLAVALETADEAPDEELVFVTRDREQAAAAKELGFAVA